MTQPLSFRRVALIGLASCLLSALAAGQCNPGQWTLTTTYAGGNGCSGNIFDVVATNSLTFCSFDVHLGINTPQTMEVWAVTGGGPYAPVIANPAAWTLLASTTVNALGAGVPTPLNLSLNYLIPAGTTQGFIIRNVTSTNIDYTNGTTVGAVAATDPNVTILQGQYTCTIGATFPVLTNAARIFNGSMRYSTENRLSVAPTSPGGSDLSIVLTNINPSATEGWLLLSLDTLQPAGSGPLLGLVPDAITFLLFFSTPLQDGNPLHFPVPSLFGLFPNSQFYLPTGTVPFTLGMVIDFSVLLVGPGFTYVGTSGVVRVTF